MKSVNFALIGCGRIAERHIDAILKNPSANIIGVCDLNEDLAKQKASLAKTKYFTDYDTMLTAHPEIDVVVLLTPSGAHFYHALDIIQKYQKHLIIEKPFVLRLEHAATLTQLAQANAVQIFPVFQNRFNKAVQYVRQAILADQLGKLRVGTIRMRWCRPQRYYDLSVWRGTWSMDGGALTNQGIHYIDLMRYICGEVKNVHSRLATLGANIEVEDTAVATLEFESGALGVIEVMTSARHNDFEASISTVCENGLAVISGIAANELITFSPDPTQCKPNSEVFPTVYGFGHDQFMHEVIDCLQNNAVAPITYDDGLKSLKLLHAIYRSDETGNVINLNEVKDSIRLGREDRELLKLYCKL